MINGADIVQKNLITYVQNLAGAGVTFTRVYYQGLTAGSEFLTYNAKKLYIAFEFESVYNNGYNQTANTGYVNFYDELNAGNFWLHNTQPYFDTTAAAVRFTNPTIEIKNIYFSRISVNAINYIKFNGLRVIWP